MNGRFFGYLIFSMLGPLHFFPCTHFKCSISSGPLYNIHSQIFNKQSPNFISLHNVMSIMYQGFSPCPAEKQATPPRPVRSKPCPAPQILTKPAGRNGAKLTEDNTNHVNKIWLRGGKRRKSFSIGLLYSL